MPLRRARTLSKLALFALGIAALAAPHASCREPAYVTLTITTDVDCAAVRGTTLTLGTLGPIETRAPYTTTLECRDGKIGTLVVVPSGGDSDEFGVRVTLGVARAVESCTAPTYGPGCVVARRALRFIPHTPLYLPIAMRTSCDGVPCGPQETCVRGTCRNARISDSTRCQSSDGCNEAAIFGDGPPADAGGDVGSDAPIGPDPRVAYCGDMSGLYADSPWPMYGGCPTHAGRSRYNGPKSTRLQWRYPATGTDADISGTPMIAGRRAFVATSGTAGAYALDLSNGARAWNVPLPGEAFAAGALDRSGRFLVGTDDGPRLAGLDSAGGAAPGYPIVLGIEPGATLRGAPVIGKDGSIYVAKEDATNGGALVAIGASGSERWSKPLVGTRSSPALSIDGARVYVADDAAVLAFEAGSGAPAWTFPLAPPVRAARTLSPTVAPDGTIYVVIEEDSTDGGSDTTYTLLGIAPDGSTTPRVRAPIATGAYTTSTDVNPPPAIGKDGSSYVLYVTGVPDGLIAVRPDGSIKWRFAKGARMNTHVAVADDGTIFTGSDAPAAYAVNPDGSQLWTYPLDTAARGGVVIGADGALYVATATFGGVLYALAP